ncbi:hypothetical protein [Arthrobacter sp. JSM 101049]|uniref:hypothetical protein n=1 Tax=Arthrobacter sp. JSM 101049 TaxID=929097 RepID=UPI003566EF7C
MTGTSPPVRTNAVPVGIRNIPPLARAPVHRECLVCYVYRMWRHHGCGDDLSLVRLYCDFSARRDRQLGDRLAGVGVHSAADLVFGAHQPNAPCWNPGGSRYAGATPDGVPACLQVATGSTAACHLWLRTTTWRVSGAGRRLTLWA